MARPKLPRDKDGNIIREKAQEAPTALVSDIEVAVSMKTLGRIYTASGATVKDALANLKVPVGKGIAILTLTKGERKKERILNSRQTFRLFSGSPLMREIALKQFTSLFV